MKIMKFSLVLSRFFGTIKVRLYNCTVTGRSQGFGATNQRWREAERTELLQPPGSVTLDISDELKHL